MREILFRGKRLSDGKMVYGESINTQYDAEGKKRVYVGALFSSRIYPLMKCVEWHEVDPDTVGQYTGLTDKNGKKIFEGDIVRILGNQDVEDWKNVDYTALIAFLDGGFCALDGTIEDHGFRRYALARLDFDLEVIGNTHDNPDLLNKEG